VRSGPPCLATVANAVAGRTGRDPGLPRRRAARAGRRCGI